MRYFRNLSAIFLSLSSCAWGSPAEVLFDQVLSDITTRIRGDWRKGYIKSIAEGTRKVAAKNPYHRTFQDLVRTYWKHQDATTIEQFFQSHGLQNCVLLLPIDLSRAVLLQNLRWPPAQVQLAEQGLRKVLDFYPDVVSLVVAGNQKEQDWREFFPPELTLPDVQVCWDVLLDAIWKAEVLHTTHPADITNIRNRLEGTLP